VAGGDNFGRRKSFQTFFKSALKQNTSETKRREVFRENFPVAGAKPS
jgi:hypothetical protein